MATTSEATRRFSPADARPPQDAPDRAPGSAGPLAGLPYWLTLGGIYLMLGEVFFFSGKAKLVDGGGEMPAELAETFSATFLASFPGLDASWILLGVMESAVFLLVVASALRGEFLPSRAKPVLFAALGLALLTFASLAFGQRLTENTEGTATLYAYFGATAAVALLLRTLAPDGRRAMG